MEDRVPGISEDVLLYADDMVILSASGMSAFIILGQAEVEAAKH